ncbi:dihydromonapterin reductase [Neptunomonas japonica]|uniref:Dihydromonapterin reductase n=1 Tax=Neptunomonas japonica JAMM 1380 TaxID=1441457 RepID=A0A7R6PAP7_9GAMM|nr:dihydromonapterin reductase [Neptunomonas japonica]BBB30349.1 dihydromonapterin reductase/dihydrofolate reductase [Neptunomonas japonica JAMM 1380]
MSAPIIITGIGKRIGYALAKYLLNSGYLVIGTYRTEYESIEELRQLGAELHCCDFYDNAQVTAFIHSIKTNHPRLRAVIHNASDWLPDSNSLSPATTLERMMQIHVNTPYQINLALMDKLQAYAEDSSLKESSDIIHFTDYVVDKGSKKHIAYAASKAALANMTLSFSALLAPKVKVNAIAPAMIIFNTDDNAEYRIKTLKKSLMEIEPGVQEIIEAVNYLLHSRYVTGRTLHVDGGRHLK